MPACLSFSVSVEEILKCEGEYVCLFQAPEHPMRHWWSDSDASPHSWEDSGRQCRCPSVPDRPAPNSKDATLKTVSLLRLDGEY